MSFGKDEKQFVRILKDGIYKNFSYFKGDVFRVLELNTSKNCARISNSCWITLENISGWGKEAEIIKIFQNKYELWEK